MCGIAGFVDFRADNQAGKSVVLLTDALAHRGPDDNGYWFADEQNSGHGKHAYSSQTRSVWRRANPESVDILACPNTRIALGHRRLSIVGQGNGAHQPMSCDEKRYIIVFNGEIYNYKALANQLPDGLIRQELICDTQVLLAGFGYYGPSFLAKLEGMFAFAVYDCYEQILYAARDIAGVKPFYFAHNADFFAFASEPKALLALPQLGCKPRPQAIQDFLSTGQTEFESQTFFEQIHQLPGGHYLRLHLKTGHKTLHSFGQAALAPYICHSSQGSTLSDLLTQALAGPVQSERPIGISLSGGLDSAALAGLAAQKFHTNLPAFTACFEQKQFDESYQASLSIHQHQLDWHQIWPKSEHLAQKMVQLSYIHEVPLQAANTYTQYCVYERAAADGMVVMLDGQGADELFGGYARHYNAYMSSLIRQKKWKQFWQEYKFADNNFANRKNIWTNFAKMQLNKMSDVFGSDVFGQTKYNLPDTIDQARYNDFFGPCLHTLLRAGDRNSMHFGIESRMPFADHAPLIAFALHNLQPADLVHQGLGKYAFRQALKGYIPEQIRLRRDKMGFATPQNSWMLDNKDELPELLVSGLSDFVPDYEHIKRNWDKLCSEKYLQNHGRAQYLWRVVALGGWMRGFGV